MEIIKDTITDNRTNAKKDTKIQQIQGLRFFAFLAIFIHHMNYSYGAGTWAVSFFFILSGTVLILSNYKKDKLSLHPKSYFSFCVKSILKLWPLHILILLLLVIQNVRPIEWEKFLLNLFLLQSWMPHANFYFSYNAVAWFLSTCIFLYFCFPFILKIFEKINATYFYVIFLFVLYAFQVSIAYASNFLSVDESVSDFITKYVVYVFPPFRLIDFSIGCSIGVLIMKLRNYRNEHQDAKTFCLNSWFGGGICSILSIMIIVGTIIPVSIYVTDLKNGSQWWTLGITFTIPNAMLIFFVASYDGFLSRFLSLKPFVSLGNVSGYSFLLHQLLIGSCNRFVGSIVDSGLKPIITFCFTLFIVLLTSYIWFLAVKGFRINIKCIRQKR